MTDQSRLGSRLMGAVGLCTIGVLALAATALLALLALLAPPPAAAQLSQTVITGPAGSGQFGKRVAFLPSGDFVVSDPGYDAGAVADVGAVHLYRGSDFSLIATLTGSTAGDQIGLDGSDPGIRVLSNGAYLVRSPNWDQPAPLLANAGALSWCDGGTGCSGVVSAANSAVGAISNAGAVRFCTASAGCSGTLSAANSLVGSRLSDSVGVPVPLTNGNYIVVSRL